MYWCYNRASDRMQKKLKIMRNFSGILCRKMCWLWGKEHWIMQKFEHLVNITLIPWAFPMNTKNTSILPTVLALYGQNKHNFCQVLTCLIFFYHLLTGISLCNTLFSSNFAQKTWKRSTLSSHALNGTMENWTSEVVSKLVSRLFLKRHMERLEVKTCLQKKA